MSNRGNEDLCYSLENIGSLLKISEQQKVFSYKRKNHINKFK